MSGWGSGKYGSAFFGVTWEVHGDFGDIVLGQTPRVVLSVLNGWRGETVGGAALATLGTADFELIPHLLALASAGQVTEQT